MALDPVVAVRKALDAPPPEDLAEPILARDLEELRSRLVRARLRGGPYLAVGFSPQVRDMVTRLDAAAAVPGAGRVH